MNGLEKLTPKHVIAVMLVGLTLLVLGAMFKHEALGNFGYGTIVVSAFVYVMLRRKLYAKPTDDVPPTKDEAA